MSSDEPPVAGPSHGPRHRRRVRRVPFRRAAYALAGALVLAAVVTGTTCWLQGYRLYVIHTGSMEPALMPGDVIVDAPAGSDYRRGEVLTFRHSDTAADVVTHRVAGIRSDGRILTKGDANRSADAWRIRPDQVRGRTVAVLPWLGYALVYLQHPGGIASLVTTGLAVVLLHGLFFRPDSPGTRQRPPMPRTPRSGAGDVPEPAGSAPSS